MKIIGIYKNPRPFSEKNMKKRGVTLDEKIFIDKKCYNDEGKSVLFESSSCIMSLSYGVKLLMSYKRNGYNKSCLGGKPTYIPLSEIHKAHNKHKKKRSNKR